MTARGVVVEGRQLGGVLVGVPLLLAGVVVPEHGSQRLVLVVDLWRHHHVAVAGELHGEAGDGWGLLEDLGIENEPGEFLRAGRMDRGVDVGPHRTRGRVEVLVFGADDHRASPSGADDSNHRRETRERRDEEDSLGRAGSGAHRAHQGHSRHAAVPGVRGHRPGLALAGDGPGGGGPARDSQGLRLLRGAPGRPRRRRRLHPAPQSPARAVVDQGRRSGQTRPLREADRAQRRRGEDARWPSAIVPASSSRRPSWCARTRSGWPCARRCAAAASASCAPSRWRSPTSTAIRPTSATRPTSAEAP